MTGQQVLERPGKESRRTARPRLISLIHMFRLLVFVVVRMCCLACHVQVGAIKSAAVEHESCFSSLGLLEMNGRKVFVFIKVYSDNLSTEPRKRAQSLNFRDLQWAAAGGRT